MTDVEVWVENDKRLRGQRPEYVPGKSGIEIRLEVTADGMAKIMRAFNAEVRCYPDATDYEREFACWVTHKLAVPVFCACPPEAQRQVRMPADATHCHLCQWPVRR